MKITKIAITGGPCGGKTSGMEWILNAFTDKGYTVLFIPETATELISGGVAPWTCATNVEYQKCQITLQIEKEKTFKYAAGTMNTDRVLIVCDRGLMDNKAYMTDEDFDEALAAVGITEEQMLNSYEAVFHLETAAKGAEEFYTTENNSARTETVEQAIIMDDKLIKAWENHHYLRLIGNNGSFEDKMNHLISEIDEFLEYKYSGK